MRTPLPEKSSPNNALVEAVASALPTDDAAEASPAPAEPSTSNDIPTVFLVQAGLTVFNIVIVLIYVAVWIIDIKMLETALRAGAGFALLLALAPMGLGVHLERKYRKQNAKPPGLIWAQVGVYAGAFMSTFTLMIPLIMSVRSVIGGPQP